MPPDFIEILPSGEMRVNMHPGQMRIWESRARTVAVFAGTQGGKTVIGPPWVQREITRCGPGDYAIINTNFPLMEKKQLPVLIEHFEQRLQLGRYKISPVRRFVFSRDGIGRTFGDSATIARTWGRAALDTPTQLVFGYAENPDSLESLTGNAAWLDECGQDGFKIGAWRAINRRMAIKRGRKLLTTTLYNLGWIISEVYDKWAAGDPDIAVINFDSIENPAFPVAEYEAARRDLPPHEFARFYQGLPKRPAGLIYGNFNANRAQVIPASFVPDPTWPRFLGLDFGGINTVGTFWAANPTDQKLYQYREYKAGNRTAAQHVAALLIGEPGLPVAVGGARSEQQWRDEFSAAGLPVLAPDIWDVELGIQRVYGLIAQDRVRVSAACPNTLADLETYHRKLDPFGQPTEEIADKHMFHMADSLRYILSWLNPAWDVPEPVTGPPRPARVGYY